MAPFTPAYPGGKSAAALIAELACDKPYGYVLTYEEIADRLGVRYGDMSRIRAAVARARERLLRDHARALETRPGEGYAIVHPVQDARPAPHKSSDRQIRRAIGIIKDTAEHDMTDLERERSRQVGIALERLHGRQQETEARMFRLESLIRSGNLDVRGTPEDGAEG